ncbi:hypothetical protein [Paenibacillus sp.]|uniref:hypothetical protein n=1 Tax=Paenibacillus sp. TaxID=58172 RepID=UPI0028A7E86E|nr:hypothetical protein [Paenibacillus sp.]
MLRVGGDMEIDVPLLLSDKKRSINDITREHYHYVWTGTGRSAIFLALEELEMREVEKTAYLPAYICDSVIQPFREKNYTIHFYSMGADLKTPGNLPEGLNNVVFLYVHYFGFENQEIKKWLEIEKSKQHFFIIEDRVQSAFSEFDNDMSDFKIYSYRKFTPQPDGALLISKEKMEKDLDSLLTSDEDDFLLGQVEGKLRRSLSMNENEFLPLLKYSESQLDSRLTLSRMSEFSILLMERMDFEQLIKKRRGNWLFLNELIERDNFIKKFLEPIFTSILDNEVPLGFPIFINAGLRNSLRQFLISHNIFCPIHWTISEKKFTDDVNISSSILTIPIDQRMNKEHILYVVEKIHEFFLEVIK